MMADPDNWLEWERISDVLHDIERSGNVEKHTVDIGNGSGNITHFFWFRERDDEDDQEWFELTEEPRDWIAANTTGFVNFIEDYPQAELFFEKIEEADAFRAHFGLTE